MNTLWLHQMIRCKINVKIKSAQILLFTNSYLYTNNFFTDYSNISNSINFHDFFVYNIK